MDFGIFANKRPSVRRLRPSLFLPLFGVASVAIALGFLSLQTTKENKPVPVSLPTVTLMAAAASQHLPVKESDETILLRQILQDRWNSREAAYVGIEKKDSVLADPDPSLMHSLTETNPALRPVSDLTEPNTPGKKRKFSLITARLEKWENTNQVCASGIYRSSGGRHSAMWYTARRNKANKTGWSLQPNALGCGYWRTITIRSRDGKLVTLSPK